MTADPSPQGRDTEILHASCVSVAGRALLILGPSGAGKSSLALRLLALGAGLVSDDRTAITPAGQALMASCPSPVLSGLVEARGIGLLHVAPAGPAPLALVADLGQTEPDRLPPRRTITLMGYTLPLVLRPQNDHLPEALFLYLKGGRQE